MLRRLHHEQPESFEFTPANLAWAKEQITKYPAGRQASAIIPLLWRAQEQEGWLSRPAIETVADMLGMAYIRALEVASFYFMFQMQPVGAVAHIQICGTLSCMICGAEDLIAVCKEMIADKPHTLSADGKFSWEEVECLGACTNAPMAQIGKDYYEDLTADSLRDLLTRLGKGEVPQVGPQNGRFAAEPLGGITSLTEYVNANITLNASAQLAHDIGDTVKRIDGTEVPLRAPWGDASGTRAPGGEEIKIKPSEGQPADKTGIDEREAQAQPTAKPESDSVPAEEVGTKPEALSAPKDGQADDLKRVKGIGPKLEEMLHGMGIFHFSQIAAFTEAELAWVDANLEGFKGRATRDEWVAQAKVLSGE
ncbi:NADH-quinone oxidoreductase subunit E [Tropicibacter naphthalenivorans]|uniref:NADH-quinone oxidoreductase chain 2 n=1 Tax=Tropicibacter naphthalenivorans TaxID=441103 RepID=A0A0P1GFG8_9RHOB|nr:NADH-quinone oxidoreductase subunit E [Tropicibacter naphthalenivorans]CUH80285.1 NADH-quinone oxidoreductase chain 2 [Tropicibacter naphthalenivorans]SMC85735.1 NADH dehydrogenase subunit E [Tropicibacter naphthalenivorans]